MKNYDLDGIFSIEEIDDNQVIIKVLADSPLKVAQYPFVSKDYAYITVTRGESHLCKVIYADGHSFSFHWGGGSRTLVGEELEELKRQVIAFINQNHIFLNYDGQKVTGADIFYNSNLGLWQVTLDPVRCHYWSKTASNEQDMIKEAEQLGIFAEEWKKGVAQTGIDIWTAVNPKFQIK